MPMMAEKLPPDFVQRSDEFNELKRRLLDAEGGTVAAGRRLEADRARRSARLSAGASAEIQQLSRASLHSGRGRLEWRRLLNFRGH